MKGRRKKGSRLTGLLLNALGLICALVLGGIFFCAMVYQLAGEDVPDASAAQAAGVLALDAGTLLSESHESVEMGGALCSVITRIYALQDGTTAEAVSAQPAAYLERMAQEKWEPQLITGFIIAGMDAVYALRGEECLLAARTGDTVYMIRTAAAEQAAYALGAGAYLEP